MDCAEEEGDGELDGRDQGEVEAGGDAFIHPGAGDGGVGFTIALYPHHSFSWEDREFILITYNMVITI